MSVKNDVAEAKTFCNGAVIGTVSAVLAENTRQMITNVNEWTGRDNKVRKGLPAMELQPIKAEAFHVLRQDGSTWEGYQIMFKRDGVRAKLASGDLLSHGLLEEDEAGEMYLAHEELGFTPGINGASGEFVIQEPVAPVAKPVAAKRR